MDFMNIIQNLGFPVACVVACAWYIYNKDKRDSKITNDREGQYIEIIKQNLETINSFTKSIDCLTDAINKLDGDK